MIFFNLWALRETNHALHLLGWGPLGGAEFAEGDATKHKSVKRSAFSLNEGNW